MNIRRAALAAPLSIAHNAAAGLGDAVIDVPDTMATPFRARARQGCAKLPVAPFTGLTLPAGNTGKRMLIKAIDFCCGAGGLTRGLLDAGISVVAGVDNDRKLQKTYEHNNAPSRFFARDITEIDIDKFRSELKIESTDLTLYSACTPCQPFSSLNTNKSEDSKKSLLLHFGKIVAQCPPDFIIVENVPGLHNAVGHKIYQKFMDVLKEQGFLAHTELLDAKDFGIPQTRKRFILIASKHGKPRLPKATTKGRPITVRKTISKYPPITDGEESKDFLNHVARKLPAHHRRIVEAVPFDGGSRNDVHDTSLLLKCHQRYPKAHKDVFGRMAWDAPSPTLTCRCTDVYCGRFIHPDQHRGISLREAAALQTFEDNYVFFGDSLLEKARQIGNAVPVILAKGIGLSITDFVGNLGKNLGEGDVR